MSQCKPIKATCKDNRLVNSVKKLISQMESDDIPNLIPMTKKELAETKNALNLYLKDCNTCVREGRSDYKCMKNAKTNLKRRIPLFANNIYPWKNFDWNYANFVSNNYTPKYTGATDKGNVRAMYNNVIAFTKLVNGLIDDPIPNKYSRAGVGNRNSDYPSFVDCTSPGCKTAQKVKNSFRQNRPTTDNFLKKNVNGEYSSSYYVKIGHCPRKDIKTQRDCEKRGYTWTPNNNDKHMKDALKQKNATSINKSGSCNQPRYGFIDNSPKTFLNGSNMKGLVPSLANDFMDLMPDKILATAMGQSIGDSFAVQQCPNTKENFSNYTRKYNILPLLSIVMVILIAFLIFYKK